MNRPRIVVIGGSYRALCVLEHLLERGHRITAFVSQVEDVERDFSPDILDLCNRSGVTTRSVRKLGEEVVRWLEDRIRPDLIIAVGVDTEIPLAIGGNSRLGLLEVIDLLGSETCPGLALRQRGRDLFWHEVPGPQSGLDLDALHSQVVEEMLDALDRYLGQLVPSQSAASIAVRFSEPALPPDTLEKLVGDPDPGPDTDALERELEAYVGADRALALNSVSDAFALLGEALGLGEGDEVICPALISGNALEALRSRGVQPVFVDVEPDRMTLDPQKLREALSGHTRALLIGHAFGQPADLAEIYAIAEQAGVEVIEDGGGSLGARLAGSRLGHSPCTCIFRMPLGGTGTPPHAALLTLPESLAARCEVLARGRRLGNAMAVALRARLTRWDDGIAARRENAHLYSEALLRYDAFRIPPTPEDALPVYASYLLRLTRFARATAGDMHPLLTESEIETRRLRAPISDRELARLPVAEAAISSGLLLPIWEGISEAQRDHVLDTLFSYAIG